MLLLWRRPPRLIEGDFASDAINLGLAPAFLTCLHERDCFADAAPSLVKLAEFRIGVRQR